MAKKTAATLDDLLIQGKITNRLLAAQLRGTMKQIELVGVLESTGATHREIADVLDTSPATISTTIRRLKAKRAKKEMKAKEKKAKVKKKDDKPGTENASEE